MITLFAHIINNSDYTTMLSLLNQILGFTITNASAVYSICGFVIVICMFATTMRNLIYKVLNLAVLSVFVVGLWAFLTDITFIYVVYILTFVSAVVMLFLSVVLMLPSSAISVSKRGVVAYILLPAPKLITVDGSGTTTSYYIAILALLLFVFFAVLLAYIILKNKLDVVGNWYTYKLYRSKVVLGDIVELFTDWEYLAGEYWMQYRDYKILPAFLGDMKDRTIASLASFVFYITSAFFLELISQLVTLLSIFFLAVPAGSPGILLMAKSYVIDTGFAGQLENLAAIQYGLYVGMPMLLLVSVTGLLVALVGAPFFASKAK